MDEATLLDAYRRVSTEELWKIINTVEDAVIRWESRVQEEPALRIRIREGYMWMSLVQKALAERDEAMMPVDPSH